MKLYSQVKIQSCLFLLLTLISILIFGCSKELSKNDTINIENDKERLILKLNLRIHIMTDITMIHPSGINMPSWVTSTNVKDIIVPEINLIWKQADINWKIESIIEENVFKDQSYEESIRFIASTERDSEGRSNPERLPHLFSLMNPQNMSTADELESNLYHIYLFPFIGNTSQGNAMRGYNFHSVVGTWTNKHNRGGVPEKTLLTENQNSYIRGSLSRTICHEIGHVLGLNHNECESNCLMGGGSNGYSLSNEQVITARLSALDRL